MKYARVLLALTTLTACAVPPMPDRCDLLITNGRVIDGTGAPPRRADVVVVGDRIHSVRELSGVERERIAAARTIDAQGLVVTPGFVDVHAHGDPLRTPAFRNFLAMGVTTICLGLDGSSPGRGDLGAWLRDVERRRPGVNVAAFVGHASVRRAAGVDANPEPTPAAIARMAELVDGALDAGAFGLSTGLEYVPGRRAGMDELVAIAQPVGARDALVASHVRNEDADAIEDSVRELLAQCARSGAHPHLSHAKIVYAHDPASADAVLELLASAGATADVYPYVASYTGLSILFPDWALPPNDYATARDTRRPELQAHLRARIEARNGPTAMLFGSGPHAGETLAEAARASNVPFEDLLLDLGPGGASAAYFVMDDAVMRRFLVAPDVMIASDGSPTMRHPRGHGTFAKVIREHVIARSDLTLAEAIRKMTSLPADTVGIEGRGRIAPGAFADLLVFDPAEVRDRATFTDPFRRADGFRHVIVNGKAAVTDGEPAEERHGRALRRTAR